MSPNSPLKEHVKDHFIPHEGNNFRPHFLKLKSATIILCLIVFIELISLAAPYALSLNKNYFLASVLPGVLVSITNQERADNKLSSLQTNSLLTKAANLKANDMATKGYFSHTTPEGYAPWYWLDKVGYSYNYAGENLAVNFFESEDVAKAWMNSPSHRENIVNPKYEEIGIGMASGVYQGSQTVFVVQFFGTPKLAIINKINEKINTAVVAINSTSTTAINSTTNITPKKITIQKPELAVTVSLATSSRTNTLLTTTSSASSTSVNQTQSTKTLGASTTVSTTTVALKTASTTSVLGAEINNTPEKLQRSSVQLLNIASATPHYDASFLLVVLGLIILSAIIFVFFSRAKIIHHDLIITGLFLIIIIASILFYNSHSYIRTVVLPIENTGSATTSVDNI